MPACQHLLWRLLLCEHHRVSVLLLLALHRLARLHVRYRGPVCRGGLHVHWMGRHLSVRLSVYRRVPVRLVHHCLCGRVCGVCVCLLCVAWRAASCQYRYRSVSVSATVSATARRSITSARSLVSSWEVPVKVFVLVQGLLHWLRQLVAGSHREAPARQLVKLDGRFCDLTRVAPPVGDPSV